MRLKKTRLALCCAVVIASALSTGLAAKPPVTRPASQPTTKPIDASAIHRLIPPALRSWEHPANGAVASQMDDWIRAHLVGQTMTTVGTFDSAESRDDFVVVRLLLRAGPDPKAEVFCEFYARDAANVAKIKEHAQMRIVGKIKMVRIGLDGGLTAEVTGSTIAH